MFARNNPLYRLAGCLLAAALLLPVAGPAEAAMIGAGTAPRAVALADLNGDGYNDLVWGTFLGQTLCVALGRGNGRFQPRVEYPCGADVWGMDVADLNGDGHLDVVVACPDINRVEVRFGGGDGTLGARTDYTANVAMNVVVADLNEDGWPDLAVPSQNSPNNLKILLATDPGVFNGQFEYPGVTCWDLAVGDLNGDGHLDVVTGNGSSNGVNVYLSTANPGIYGAPVTYSTQGGGTSVLLSDLNHDGALDIIVPNSGFKCLNVRLGIGNGTFNPNTVYPLDGEAFGGTIGDFNGDGNPDVAVSVYGANEMSLFLGTGTGTFQPKIDYFSGINPCEIVAGNIDNDGIADLAIASQGSNSICTLPGNGNGTFQVPSGPVYVWAPASGTAIDANAWLPPRNSGTPNDILVFNRGGAVSVGSVPTSTVGQIVISGGTQASFFSLLGTMTLTVGGGTGDDVVIEEGSKGILSNNSNPLTVALATGAHATVYGDVELRGSTGNRFLAQDPSGLIFQSTGRAIIGPGASTLPFGNGTSPSGLNSVRFLYGSQYIAQTPVSVFGATSPQAVVSLGPGSRFRMDVAFNPDLAGRTMGDFEYNVPGGISAITGSSPLVLDSLFVTQGTLSVELTGSLTIRGNIVNNVCSGPNTIRFLPPTPTTYQLAGTSRQSLYATGPNQCFGSFWRVYASSNVTWDINNPAGIDVVMPWHTPSNFLFTHGNIVSRDFWQFLPDSSSTLTGASQSTGWVETGLTRRVTADGVVRLDVGDSANYLPIDIDVHGVTKPGYFTVGTSAWDPYDVGRAQLDEAHRVHRNWFVMASNVINNFPPRDFFASADPTFRFLPGDLGAGSDPLQFVTRFRWLDNSWRASTPGIRTATSTQMLGWTPTMGDSTWGIAIGQPITPSLSVFNASSPEGNGPGSVVPVAAAMAAPRVAVEPVSEGEVIPFRLARTQPASSAAVAPVRTQDAGSLTFRVRLSQVAVVPISVDYQTVDGTATVADGDYTPTSGTLTFAPGDSALDIVVPFGVDATPEHNETFGLTLSNASNATIATPSATGTIVDDDDLIAPTAQVIYPNGGEVIHQNQPVTLQWTASDNVGVNGVDIQLVNGASVTTLASNSPNTGSYNWLSTGPASTKMKFRIVAHDDNHATTDNSDANWQIDAYTIGVGDEVPVAFGLAAPSPNPSPAGPNRIAFSVPREARVRLSIHDVRGRTVAELADGVLPAGHHVRTWDASSVGAGVYFVRFEAPGFHADQRLVVVK